MCNLSQGFVDMGRREGRTEGEQRMYPFRFREIDLEFEDVAAEWR